MFSPLAWASPFVPHPDAGVCLGDGGRSINPCPPRSTAWCRTATSSTTTVAVTPAPPMSPAAARSRSRTHVPAARAGGKRRGACARKTPPTAIPPLPPAQRARLDGCDGLGRHHQQVVHLGVEGRAADPVPSVRRHLWHCWDSSLIALRASSLCPACSFPSKQHELSTDMETYISQVELVAALCAYYSLPELLEGRAVVHFIDNTAALSALVHGYASKPDMARLVNLFHAQLVALECWFYGEWVPSKANPADVPTRPDRWHEIPPTAVEVPMVIPDVAAVEADVAAWIHSVRARAARRDAAVWLRSVRDRM